MQPRLPTILRVLLVAFFVAQIVTNLPPALAADNSESLSEGVYLFDDNADGDDPEIQCFADQDVFFVSLKRPTPLMLNVICRQSLAAFNFQTTGPPSF